MKLPNPFAVVCAVPLLLAASWTLAKASQGEPEADQPVTAASARKAIQEGNRAWGAARVAYDRPTMEKMLASDFYVAFPNRRASREEFLNMVSRKEGMARLVRFDVEVLTVERKDGQWAAVIAEKLEFDVVTPDGETVRDYALWITRDGWRQENGAWVIAYSEVIGHEFWAGGKKPPFSDW